MTPHQTTKTTRSIDAHSQISQYKQKLEYFEDIVKLLADDESIQLDLTFSVRGKPLVNVSTQSKDENDMVMSYFVYWIQFIHDKIRRLESLSGIDKNTL